MINIKDTVQFVNNYEEYLDEENPTGKLEGTGENARAASNLLSFFNTLK